MVGSDRSSRVPLAGVVFLVLAVAGNAVQGSTPAMHSDGQVVAAFYEDKATAIALGMMLSIISVFFLAWFLASLRAHLARWEGSDGWISPLAWGGGVATMTLLAAGFAVNSVGALRAREGVLGGGDVAAVFYDGSQGLTGLAASIAMAVLLAASAAVVLQHGGLPRWFGWASAVLAAIGLVTPVSFLLSLLFPFWVAGAAVLLVRAGAPAEVPSTR